MPSRKTSRNQVLSSVLPAPQHSVQTDYAGSTSSRGYSTPGYSYPVVPPQYGYYGSYNPYGTVDRRSLGPPRQEAAMYNYDPYRCG